MTAKYEVNLVLTIEEVVRLKDAVNRLRCHAIDIRNEEEESASEDMKQWAQERIDNLSSLEQRIDEAFINGKRIEE